MAKNTRRARCHITAFDELECMIPFHRGLVDAWKASIPSRHRSYDPDSKAWRFWGGAQGQAIAILLRYHPDADVPDRWKHRAPASAPADSESAHFRVLHLRETAPAELVTAAYRCLSKILHPDVGGDPEMMRRLNEAHDALTRRLSA